MRIAGIQKLSMVDFDEHLSATIFTSGCNFACPFCHNSSLIGNNNELISEDDILDFLYKRKNMLDAVCISGGEPTLQKDLPQFISKIKKMGYLIKLDTNGTNPDMIKYLYENNLIDYVAMDIKNHIEKYQDITQTNLNLDNILKSITYIMKCGIDYEFRTTLINEFHEKSDIIKIGKLIKSAKRYFLQKFVDSENCLSKNLSPIPKEQAIEFQEILCKYIKNTNLRGY
ncbi:MAG: anaerobic ribonucleoside-triphosphate reductase activating protein [Clostridiales bacterium]|nr:anaerobic ribonucleoside-triphosphate reductase activating protein [Clostridiales bacterium]